MTVHWGRADSPSPAVGMGTWRTFDVRGAAAERHAHTIVDEALAVGARFVDSSPMHGQAERMLGQALAGRRAQALVATRVWTSSVDQGQEPIKRAYVARLADGA